MTSCSFGYGCPAQAVKSSTNGRAINTGSSDRGMGYVLSDLLGFLQTGNFGFANLSHGLLVAFCLLLGFGSNGRILFRNLNCPVAFDCQAGVIYLEVSDIPETSHNKQTSKAYANGFPEAPER
ncbi:MAG: hypothetical protein M3O22_00375 [Pseudomonadota bacterium]|nr:hypothetical protein [Pseudomonadota bacterium]